MRQSNNTRLSNFPTTGIEGRLGQFFKAELEICVNEKFQWLSQKDDIITLESQKSEAIRIQNEWKTTQREKAKTSHILLLMCLNVGVDPPDVLRTEPCAVKECWVDPLNSQSKYLMKGSEVIAEKLEEQYKAIHRNALYKRTMEPAVEDVKNLLTQTRVKANDGRILVHYNGHGVPAVSTYGELWFFDQEHTKYVAMTITDIASCVESPSLYVLDCNCAGTIVNYWNKQGFPSHPMRQKDIILCACSEGEYLPQNPNVPADILTSCLTTPVKMALEWYYSYSQREVLLPNITYDMICNIPGDATNKRSPMGELTWIFTCLTDTIAWCTLPRDQFQRLYRQDMMLVSLFRNYVLADRILRHTGCTPVCYPPMPTNMHNHRLWDAWDLAVESVLCQLPFLLTPELKVNESYTYQNSSFFSDQLTAFEVNIELGAFQHETKIIQEQLPCVILCLSSQTYRVRGLQLLALYLDMGVWAVNDALICGIMPYVLHLLKSPDLQFLLCAIWVKIFCVDRSEGTCNELFRVNAHKSFIRILQADTSATEPTQAPIIKEASEGLNLKQISTPLQEDTYVPLEASSASSQIHLVPGMTTAMCQGLACYMLCALCTSLQNHSGQILCWNAQLLPACLPLLNSDDASLRTWSILTIAKLLEDLADAREHFCKENVYRKVLNLVTDPSPRVRAAVCALMSRTVGRSDLINIPALEQERRIHVDVTIFKTCLPLSHDVSPLVRQEFCILLGKLLEHYLVHVSEDAWQGVDDDPTRGEAQLRTSCIEVTPSTVSTLSANNPSDNPFIQKEGSQITAPTISTTKKTMTGTHSPQSHSPKHGVLSTVAAMYSSYLAADVVTLLARMIHDGYPSVTLLAKTIVSSTADGSLYPGKAPWAESLVYNEMRDSVECPLFGSHSRDHATDKERGREAKNREVLRHGLLSTLTKNFSNPAENSTTQRKLSRFHCLTGSADPVIRCRFQQYDSKFFIADSRKISVVDVMEGPKDSHGLTLNSFAAVDSRSQIRDIVLVNDYTLEPIVAVGDSNGNVFVYSNSWMPSNRPVMPLAFRVPSTNTTIAKVMLEWRQRDSLLLYGSGAEGKILLYNLNEERLLQTLTGTGSATLTCETCDLNGNMVLGGFNDGCVRLWDTRQGKSHMTLVTVYNDELNTDKSKSKSKDAGTYPVNCCLLTQRNQVTVGYSSGTVCTLDLRNMHQATRRTEVCRSGGKLIGFDVHRQLPVMSCVSSDNTLEVFNLRGDAVLTVSKLKETNSLTMHPLKPMFAVDHEVFIL
eukprot:PhF_6_TR26202/c0_g1_i1/m.37310/K07204/RAPTOR; regulatory associated protein of mTOR